MENCREQAARLRAPGQRGMPRYPEALRRFAVTYAQRQRKLSGMARPPWTTEILVELAACFQLPPFADYYAVVPRDNRCPHCRADLSSRDVATVRGVFPDRTLHACKHCNGRWLVLKES